MEASPRPVGAGSVHALVVTAGGPDLSDVLTGLSQQKRRPDAVTLIVVGDLPRAANSEVRHLFGERGQIVQLETARNFGEALRMALTSPAIAGSWTWYWLLHDDSRPEPDALVELLVAANEGAAIAAVGPKQVDWEDGSVLLELGIEATRSGRRLPLGLVEEIDQGQHDDRTDILAAGTAGMLVSAEAFGELRGFDPRLGPYGDGLEFGRRLRRAGYRVVAAPRARVAHRRQSLTGQNPVRGFRDRRTAQLYNWLLAEPALLAPFLLVGLSVWSVGRAFARLLQRQPGLAAAELGAYVDLLAAVPALARARRRTRRVARVPRKALASLEASPRQLEARRSLARRVRRHREKPEDQADVVSRRLYALQQRSNNFALLFVLALSGAAAFHFWHPVTGIVGGSAWAELPTSTQTLWRQAFSPWVFGGVGAPGPVNPTLPIWAILSAPFALLGLTPTMVLRMAIAAALPFAAWGMWVAAGMFTKSARWKTALVLLWVFQPAFLLAIQHGDGPGILVWTGLPWAFVGLWRATQAGRPLRVHGVEDLEIWPRHQVFTWAAVGALGAAGASAGAPGLLLFVIPAAYAAAFLPLTGAHLVPAAGQRVLGAEARGNEARSGTFRMRGGLGLRVLGATLVWFPAAILTAPQLSWAIRYVGDPHLALQSLFAPTGIRSYGAVWMELVPWAAATSVLAVAGGAVSLVLSFWRRGAGAWLIRGSLVFAVVAALLTVWGGVLYLSLVAVGALANIVAMGAALRPTGLEASAGKRWATAGPGGPQALLGAGAALIAAILSFAGTVHVTKSAVEELELESVRWTGPLVSREAASSPRAARTLVIDQDTPGGPVTASLWRLGARSQEDLSWGLAMFSGDTSGVARALLAETAAEIAAGPSLTAAEVLSAYGVEIILFPPAANAPPWGDEAPLTVIEGPGSVPDNLDHSPGLERIGTTERGSMWRVRPTETPPAAARFVGGEYVPSRGDGVNTHVDTSENEVVVLAEVADPYWKASFAGETLAATTDPEYGWRQAFAVPAGSGQLKISYAPPWLYWWYGALAAAALTIVLAALPTRPRSQLWLATQPPRLESPGEEAEDE